MIYLIFRYRSNKFRYSTQINIALKDWDTRTQRPIEKERRPDLWTIRRTLDDIAEQTRTVYIENDYGALSKDEFKQQLDIRLGRAEFPSTEKAIPFFKFIEQELQEMQNTNMKHSSYKSFKLHTDILKKFAKAKGRFSYDDVDWSLRLKLIDWLASKNVQLAYGNKTLNILRQFMERARRKGHHACTAY